MKRFFALFLLVFLSANLSAEGEKDDWLNDGGKEEIIVKFESEPSGATVIVDGKVICPNTPCSQTITVGEHEIAMKKEDYATKVKKGKITESKTIKYKLEPDGAYLTITGNEVEVSLDGENIGLIPIKNKIIPAGEHRIEHSNPCYSEQVEIFTVANGEKINIGFKLKPRESAIKVYAKDGRGNAVKADVYVDGKKLGKAPGTFKVPLCSKKVVVTKNNSELEAVTKEEDKRYSRKKYSREEKEKITELEYSAILSLEEKQVKTIQASLLQWVEPKCDFNEYRDGIDMFNRDSQNDDPVSAFEFAVNCCKDLNAGGFNDWRLPNIDELRTVIKNSPETEIGGECKANDQNGEFSTCHCEGRINEEALERRGEGGNKHLKYGYYSKLLPESQNGSHEKFSIWSSSRHVYPYNSWGEPGETVRRCCVNFDYRYDKGVSVAECSEDRHTDNNGGMFTWCVR